jgi:hypothetical protein
MSDCSPPSFTIASSRSGMASFSISAILSGARSLGRKLLLTFGQCLFNLPVFYECFFLFDAFALFKRSSLETGFPSLSSRSQSASALSVRNGLIFLSAFCCVFGIRKLQVLYGAIKLKIIKDTTKDCKGKFQITSETPQRQYLQKSLLISDTEGIRASRIIKVISCSPSTSRQAILIGLEPFVNPIKRITLYPSSSKYCSEAKDSPSMTSFNSEIFRMPLDCKSAKLRSELSYLNIYKLINTSQNSSDWYSQGCDFVLTNFFFRTFFNSLSITPTVIGAQVFIFVMQQNYLKNQYCKNNVIFYLLSYFF